MPTANEKAIVPAVQKIPSKYKTTFSTKNLQLYIFKTGTDYPTFIGLPSITVQLAGQAGFSDQFYHTSEVFELIGPSSSFDASGFLPGALMHEIGHDVDFYTTPTPSAVPAFVTAANNSISLMKGTWPSPKKPTCAQVYGSAASSICVGANLTISPWQIFLTTFIQEQSQNPELFADAFQNCSSYGLSQLFAAEDAAEQSTYMKPLWTYMSTNIWTGGCPRKE